ncbi:hypothetical protein PCASD_07035 [Puccinia coronata f. sp. avenae]|uniref:Uncharacterized protein n=1 Tax=Puccinia coronata f. sp. avenae TaxID=200324 RepID=A0A2N5V6S4_9BASI|nr:hypothetical protein PCASD_07035 [Puccinia coronata f. sp. avenae]
MLSFALMAKERKNEGPPNGASQSGLGGVMRSFSLPLVDAFSGGYSTQHIGQGASQVFILRCTSSRTLIQDIPLFEPPPHRLPTSPNPCTSWFSPSGSSYPWHLRHLITSLQASLITKSG